VKPFVTSKVGGVSKQTLILEEADRDAVTGLSSQRDDKAKTTRENLQITESRIIEAH